MNVSVVNPGKFCLLFNNTCSFDTAPITDEYKKGPMEGRALYLDAQATTPLVSLRCDVI